MIIQRLRKSVSIVALTVSALFLSDCAKNPVTGKKQFVLISEQQEIALGKSSHPEILAEFGQVDDAELQAYLTGIGQEMAGISHRPELPWTFTVVDSPVVNAFALPGGFIYFTRGLLAYMNNEAELAGVMGHEVGHVTARHSVSQISKVQLFGLGLGLGSVFSPTFRQLSDLAQMGVGLLFLKYSRDAERESDQLGVTYMHKAGYEPSQMSSFFQVFQGLSERSGQPLPSWLSSHPAPPDRMENTRRLATSLTATDGREDYRIRREEFLRQVDGIIYGENPREGFVQGGRFLHPDLRFQLSIPPGWRTINSKASVVIAEPNGSAAIQLTLSAQRDLTLEGRVRQLADQPGVEIIRSRRLSVHGNRAFQALFRVSQQNGSQLTVLSNFISYRGLIYELHGMALSANFDRFFGPLEGTISSFQELKDTTILKVQPDRLLLHRSRSGESLSSIAKRYENARVDLEDLALLNRLDPDERLAPGAWVKVVKAGR